MRFRCNLSLSLYGATAIKTSGNIQVAELIKLRLLRITGNSLTGFFTAFRQ